MFDVWESPEAFAAFGEKLVPLTVEAGLPQVEPHVVELHNVVTS